MNLFHNLSIRQKWMLSVVGTMLLLLSISSVLGLVIIGTSMREDAIAQELPAVVGEICNDILR